MTIIVIMGIVLKNGVKLVNIQLAWRGVAHFCLNIPSSYQSEGDHRNKAFIYQKHSTILYIYLVKKTYVGDGPLLLGGGGHGQYSKKKGYHQYLNFIDLIFTIFTNILNVLIFTKLAFTNFWFWCVNIVNSTLK